MAYTLDGPSSEDFGFTATIANFALRALHESTGLVNFTTTVAPNQGNEYLVPNFAPITYQDYEPNAYQSGNAAVYGNGFGTSPAAFEQNPALAQRSITAAPAVAATAFDVFYAWTTSFQLAATLGEELGESYGEKVDIRVCQAFTQFKATVGNQNYAVTPADGFNRPLQLGAMELLPAGSNTTANSTAGFTSTTVLELIRNVKQNYKVARLPGVPVIVLDSNGDDGVVGSTQTRLLQELTGGAVNNNLSALGNELLTTGAIENVYGCRVVFTTFLSSASRTIDGVASTSCLVGSYFHDSALITVIKEGLQIKMGEKPGGLQMWLTGLAYMGSGVADLRRGGAINIQQA
jgi:hypothetical protein